jgi:hypothetical protein
LQNNVIYQVIKKKKILSIFGGFDILSSWLIFIILKIKIKKSTINKKWLSIKNWFLITT